MPARSGWRQGPATGHDQPAQASASLPLSLAPSEPPTQLRLHSLGWVLLAAFIAGAIAHDLTAVMMDLMQGWLALWLPLIGSALLLHGARSLLPAPRP